MTQATDTAVAGGVLLGRIIRLQIQTAGLKVGPRGRRTYLPAPIRSVPAIWLTPHGVTADHDGQRVLDVHHRDHPDSKWAGNNGVSVLFSHHYELMRERFGPHITDGIAGESILVETGRKIEAEDVRHGLLMETGDGVVALHDLAVAEPCVEYTRYALQRPAEERADSTLTAALDFLRGGMRGFYARYSGEPHRIVLGDRVWLPAINPD